MTDQNTPPVPPSDPTRPAAPDSTAPDAAGAPESPAAPGYDAPEWPAAPEHGTPQAPPAPGYAAPQAPPAYSPPAYGGPAYGAPAYGAPAYGAPAGYGQPGAAPKTNTFAIISLVASIAGFVTGITFLVGVIFGHLSLSQIKRTGEAGRGMAIAGLVIGYVGILFAIIATIAFFALIATFGSMDFTEYQY